jgi:hypothetical protein
MKKVLSLLVAFVFLQVQTWALSGGPNYGQINNNVSGTYAGTIIGSIGTSGLGLFQIGMPTSGLGSGTFAFFVGGGAFFGTVVALADGEKATMDGILKGQLTQSRVVTTIATGTGTATVTEVVALMGGQFLTTIVEGATGSLGVGSRIVGTADVTTSASGTTPLPAGLKAGSSTLIVDGFQQSSQVTGEVDLSTLTGTTSSTGS